MLYSCTGLRYTPGSRILSMKKQKAKTKKIAARSTKGLQKFPPVRQVKSGGAKRNGAGTNPQRVQTILQKLDEAYPNVTCALVHDNPFQLLISTILSAQCTDETVNRVTKTLFAKYRTPADFAHADPAELELDIR